MNTRDRQQIARRSNIIITRDHLAGKRYCYVIITREHLARSLQPSRDFLWLLTECTVFSLYFPSVTTYTWGPL